MALRDTSLSDQLRLDCERLYARLRLIPEIGPWLGTVDQAGRGVAGTLWDCFFLGVPLCSLLESSHHAACLSSLSHPKSRL